MEWKSTKSDTPDLLCSAEFTSRYPETNEKVFSELMANEMSDEWKLEPSIKSKKVRIDGMIRLARSFINEILIQILWRLMLKIYYSKSFEKVRYRYFATDKAGSEVVVATIFNFYRIYRNEAQSISVIVKTMEKLDERNAILTLIASTVSVCTLTEK